MQLKLNLIAAKLRENANISNDAAALIEELSEAVTRQQTELKDLKSYVEVLEQEIGWLEHESRKMR